MTPAPTGLPGAGGYGIEVETPGVERGIRVPKRLGFPIAVVAAALAIGASTARAVPLDTAACASLDQERNALEGSGVIGELRMTPADAKALPKDKVLRIQRYVEISGQLLFRCVPAVKTVADVAAATADATAPAKRKTVPALHKKN